jgi:hypothetical protein
MGKLWGASAGGGFEEPAEGEWKPAYPVPRNRPEKEVEEILSSKKNMLSLVRAKMSMYILISWFLLLSSFALRALLSSL